MHDSYIRAIRWASDRIGESGVVCFVTNGGWLRGEQSKGMRSCLKKEFDGIYILDLRGHKEYRRMTREQMNEEGDNIFESGSTASIAITMLVKRGEKSGDGTIWYHDIGKSLLLMQKKELLVEYQSIEPKWQVLTPDKYGDWLDQRDDDYYDFMPIGS